MKTVLTIAGSDSGGGAGIQADMKTLLTNGVYSACAVTAVTCQNTLGVYGIQEITPDILEGQLEAVFSDLAPDAVKIGMISSAEQISVIAKILRKYQAEHIVIDPVMISTSGTRLLPEDAENALRRELFPLAEIITPNIPEARELLFRETICEERESETDVRSNHENISEELMKEKNTISEELMKEKNITSEELTREKHTTLDEDGNSSNSLCTAEHSVVKKEETSATEVSIGTEVQIGTEAQIGTEVLIATENRMVMEVQMAKKLAESLHTSVLLKGGHRYDDFAEKAEEKVAADILWEYSEGKQYHYTNSWIDNPNTHGTGCTLSSAIAANLAKGYSLRESVGLAKKYISACISRKLVIGHGNGPLDHSIGLTGQFMELP